MAAILRQRAEELLNKKPLKPGSPLSEFETLKLIHESEVHQLELDITRQKESLEKLKVSDKRFSSYISLTGQLPWTTNPAGEVVEDIPYFRKFTGQTYDEVKGAGWISAIHPDDVRQTLNDWNQAVAAKSSYETEYRLKRFDAVYRHFLAKGFPILDDNGEISEWVGICVDITERKQSEIILLEEKKRMRSIIDLIGDPIFVKDNDHRITIANRAFYDIFCLDENSVIGYTLVEAVPENERKQFLEVDRRVLDTGKPDLREEDLTVGDLTRKIITRKASFIDNSGDRYLVGSIHDITARVKAEAEIKSNEKRFRELIESLPQLFWTCRVDGPCDYLGKQWVEYTGIPEAEQLGYRWLEQLHPVDKERTVSEWMEKVKTGDSFDIEFRIRRNDGLYHWFKTRAVPMRDAEGNIIKWFGSNTDFDELKKAEEQLQNFSKELEQKVNERTLELQKSKKLLDETGRLARVGGWEIDLKGNSLYWSETTYKIHEVDPGFVPTVELGINFYAPEAIPVISRYVDRAIRLGEPFDVELELITAKKNRLWVRAIGEAYRENDEIVKIGGVFQDINTRKLIEEELKKHREHLEELVAERTTELAAAVNNLERSNQELEQFAYVASHDLQEPLRMVSSYTQLLERRYKDKLDQDANDFIYFAVDGANRMQQLINDLLEYSRVTTKGKTLVKTDLSTVLGHAIANLQKRIQETGAMIVNDELPYVLGDENQLVRVFQNLLDNAMKFMGAEHPRINITAQKTDDKVVISISDNGIGIDRIYSERVFAIFQRLHNKTEYPGTGIGLAICKRIIERHNGKIWFESEPGKGTTFSFNINIK